MNDCLFCKIVRKEIPSAVIYEDDAVISFLDIHPNNPGHALIVPKRHSKNIFDMPDDDMTSVFAAAKKVAAAVKSGVEADGINISMNNEPVAGQVIFHSHVHVIPRFSSDGFRHWPGKPYKEGQMEEVRKRVKKAMTS